LEINITAKFEYFSNGVSDGLYQALIKNGLVFGLEISTVIASRRGRHQRSDAITHETNPIWLARTTIVDPGTTTTILHIPR
jgi:hypothetical protein